MRLASLSILSIFIVSQAEAVALNPGDSLNSSDIEFAEILDGDPDFFGTFLGSGSASAQETRDGVGFGDEVIEDLYDVTGTIDVEVYQGDNGRTVFAYDFSHVDASGTGDSNGVDVFSVSGFAGYDVDVGWNFDSIPYLPGISRSNDGDTITIDYFDPTVTRLSLETLLFSTDAPSFAMNGAGSMNINLDSFGGTLRMVDGLPAPAPIPLPGSGLLLAGGVLLMLRRRK